jgi:hypothetical protein
MLQADVVEEIRTHIIYYIIFFRRSCPFSDNLAKCGRVRQNIDDDIIRRRRFACWITKAADAYSEYVILFAFAPQQGLRERASMLPYS